MKKTLLALLVIGTVGLAQAQTNTLNLYSARHYSTDEALYNNFTKATGITINRVDADDAGILARLKAEGSASSADVILLVDAARLWKAQVDGLFAPIQSATLKQNIPVQYRAKEEADGITWFGFSSRARVIVYDKTRIARTSVDRYEKLASPALKGTLCTRSGSHPYNLSLFSAMLEHLGAEQTQEWLKGLVANMARSPKGGDTDQIKGVASGECAVALTNTYYLARLMRSDNPADKAVVEKVGVIFPNQDTWGTHVNVAGGAVAKHAKNREAAIKFLEYLASAQAQNYFANGNNEWAIVPSVKPSNSALQAMVGGNGEFKREALAAGVIGMNQIKVQQMLDRVGYK